MKKFLVVFSILFSTSVSAVAQQLTKADLQSLEAQLTKIQETVTDMDKRLSNQIAALDTFVRWAIGVLVLVVLAVIALPQIFGKSLFEYR